MDAVLGGPGFRITTAVVDITIPGDNNARFTLHAEHIVSTGGKTFLRLLKSDCVIQRLLAYHVRGVQIRTRYYPGQMLSN